MPRCYVPRLDLLDAQAAAADGSDLQKLQRESAELKDKLRQMVAVLTNPRAKAGLPDGGKQVARCRPLPNAPCSNHGDVNGRLDAIPLRFRDARQGGMDSCAKAIITRFLVLACR